MKETLFKNKPFYWIIILVVGTLILSYTIKTTKVITVNTKQES